MFCVICRKHEKFSCWESPLVSGCKSFRTDSLYVHAHTSAHVKCIGAENVSDCPQEALSTKLFSKMQHEELQTLFNASYAIAKHDFAF